MTDSLPPAITEKDRKRFASKVRKDSQTSCEIWLGYTDKKGYGQFWWKNRMVWAHRWAYEVFKGPIENGLTVHHTCGNPSCVNPGHLTLLENSENVAEGNERRAKPWLNKPSTLFPKEEIEKEGEIPF